MGYTIKTYHSDYFGVIAGVLCVFHCLATPFIFIANACSTSCCSEAPVWWQLIDYLFLVISFIAIYYATRNSNRAWIRIALWSAWLMLLFTILNESLELIVIPRELIYVPGLIIVGLHLYNGKYCKCAGEQCCMTLNETEKTETIEI